MQAIILDYDGVILRSEIPKALGWVLAALYILQRLPEEFFQRLRQGERSAISVAHSLCQREYTDAVEQVTTLAGMTRAETRDRVWELLVLASHYKGSLTREDLEHCRNAIKDALIFELCEPIPGAMAFLQLARHRGLSLGLVTQAARKDLEEQARSFHVPLHVFTHIECVGDVFYARMSLNKKAVGYALACSHLGVRPAETVAVEDSTSGIEAANAVGVVTIGVKDPHNRQDLSGAALVVPADLGALAQDDVLTLFLREEPQAAIEQLRLSFREA